MQEPGRRTFSVRELLVLVVVLSLLFAFLGPLFIKARESARQTQCVNNLKQLGLGIQNYHDIRREIPSSYLTDDNSPAALPTEFVTWPKLLLGYLQSTITWT